MLKVAKVKIFQKFISFKSNYRLGVKELSRVIYSAERGKLETVLLKPGASTSKGLFFHSVNNAQFYSLVLYCRRESSESASSDILIFCDIS